MKTVKSTDSFCSDIWKVMDGIITVAVCYTEEEAEVCKEALEKHKAEKEWKESHMW